MVIVGKEQNDRANCGLWWVRVEEAHAPLDHRTATRLDLQTALLDMTSLDLMARRVAMASMAYYGLDEALLTDAEFDAYCRECADRWKELSPERKFALGSAAQIRSSGFHVKVSAAAEAGCIAWLKERGLMNGRTVTRNVKQRKSKRVGRWTPATGYQWSV